MRPGMHRSDPPDWFVAILVLGALGLFVDYALSRPVAAFGSVVGLGVLVWVAAQYGRYIGGGTA